MSINRINLDMWNFPWNFENGHFGYLRPHEFLVNFQISKNMLKTPFLGNKTCMEGINCKIIFSKNFKNFENFFFISSVSYCIKSKIFLKKILKFFKILSRIFSFLYWFTDKIKNISLKNIENFSKYFWEFWEYRFQEISEAYIINKYLRCHLGESPLDLLIN